MTRQHPKLCVRPQPHAALHRPTLCHAVLGTLEFVNRNGSWWQGIAEVADESLRLDVQEGANPSEDALDRAGRRLQWVQQNEPLIRSHIAAELAAGRCDVRVPHYSTKSRVEDPGITAALRPCMLVLWNDHAELNYDCTVLPEGQLLGCHVLQVSVDAANSLSAVRANALDFRGRAAILFERRLPPEALDFKDSIGDQFIAQAAAVGTLQLDQELADLLQSAIADVEHRIANRSAECASYMTSVKHLLLQIAKTPQTIVQTIDVVLRIRHLDGKRMPIKEKLVFAPTDRAQFDGAGSPRVCLFSVSDREFQSANDPVAAFRAAFVQRLQEATAWLAKQSPAVFAGLREAGFATDVLIYAFARFGSAPVTLDLPTEFLAQCDRHGLGASIATYQRDG